MWSGRGGARPASGHHRGRSAPHRPHRHRRGVTAAADALPGPLRPGSGSCSSTPRSAATCVTLQPGAVFHTHAGIVAHDDVIGRPEGSTVAASTGRRFVVVRPTLADVVLEDAPWRPGHLPEGPRRHPRSPPTSGRGCGCSRRAWGRGRCRWRCCGPGPRSSATRCAPTSRPGRSANVAAWAGPDARYRVEERDVYAGIDETRPRPRRARPARTVAGRSARAERPCGPGGILLAYLPSITPGGDPAGRP